MYTEQELLSIQNQQKKRWIILGCVCLVLAGGIVYSLVIRSEALTTGLSLLMGALLIFFYELAIKPLHCYAVLLNSFLHGRTRELDCTYLSADADVSVVDGVQYYALSLEQTDDDGEPFERMLYWDVQKPLPNLQGGEKLHIVYHDRMVADLTVL